MISLNFLFMPFMFFMVRRAPTAFATRHLSLLCFMVETFLNCK